MKKEQKKTQDPAQEDTRMPLTRRNYVLPVSYTHLRAHET